MNESNIFGVSLRGIIALIIVIAICFVCIINTNDSKIAILKDLALLVLGYYFGQRQQGGSSNVQKINDNSNVSVSADNKQG